MSIYESLQRTLAKLQKPAKFGKVVKYYVNKTMTSWIELESIKGDTSSRFGGGKPGRRKEVDVTFTLTKDQWLSKTIQPPEVPPVVQDVVPTEGFVVEADGRKFRVDGVDASEIAYVLTCTDLNR